MDGKQLNKLLFHVRRLYDAPLEEPEHHWVQAQRCADELLAQPGDPQQLALRKLLEEFRSCSDARVLPANFIVFQRALESATASRAAARSAPSAESSPVSQVAGLLRGRAVLMIGGLPRKQHIQRIRSAFELSELIWPLSREQKPDVAALEPSVARADVAVVLLLIRWIRHALGDVAGLCSTHDKPLVRVPGGYNVEQLAPQILAQCGRRLAGD